MVLADSQARAKADSSQAGIRVLPMFHRRESGDTNKHTEQQHRDKSGNLAHSTPYSVSCTKEQVPPTASLDWRVVCLSIVSGTYPTDSPRLSVPRPRQASNQSITGESAQVGVTSCHTQSTKAPKPSSPTTSSTPSATTATASSSSLFHLHLINLDRL